MDEMKNANTRTYTVVIETDNEIPALSAVAVRFDASSRTEAENLGWRWASENELTVVDIAVYLK